MRPARARSSPAGGQIKLVQIHTIARAPAEAWVAALSPEEVDALAELVRGRTGLPVAGVLRVGELTPKRK